MTVLLAVLPVIAAIGAALYEGEPKTNAKWLTWATGLEKGIARAGRWAHRPRLQRRVIQAAAIFLAAEIAFGVVEARGVTILVLSLAAVALAAWTLAWAYRKARQHATVIGRATLKEACHPDTVKQWWNHRQGYTVRLRDSLTPVFGVTPWRVKLSPDLSEVKIRPPHTFAARPDQMEAINSTVSTLLPVEGLDMEGSKLHGFGPLIRYAQLEPPPRELYWDDRVAAICQRAKSHELIIGIGHKGATVKASLEADSPHLGIGMGTGAGKSNLAAFWLIQRLRKGDIALLIDGKRFSYPWAFKDMDANYDLLPNVAYVREISDIHDALVWIGMELAERNERTEQVINAAGDLLGEVGHRIFIVCEELNLVVPQLKSYWQAVRGSIPNATKESPALMALSAVAAAGRAVAMHQVFIGQRLDADVLASSGTKGGAVRGNIGIRCLARYDDNSWRVQAGSIPMPPSPSVVGRIQAWIGGQVSECQVPLINKQQARELAVAGVVTPCPVGMPGRAQSLSVLDRPAIAGPPEQGIVLGQPPPRPPNWVTLTQAHAAGVFNGRTKEAVQRASTRSGFPEPVVKGGKGRASLYDINDLYAMQRDKELVR